MIQKKVFLFLFGVLSLLLVNAHPIEDSVTTITINAVGGLQYDIARFAVSPGATVKIILTNNDDMTHNLVITAPRSREEVVNVALKLGDNGVKMDYVPKVSKVLWYIKLLAPGETKSVTFTAPKEMGVYPYVCTYPGHGFVMFGAMYVTNKPLPAIENDLNVPERSRKPEIVGNNNMHQMHAKPVSEPAHPYKETPPYLYRTFMPDASPAAIAVRLPNSLSYCWDAGTCKLRYAWQGDFLDNSAVWKGHKDAYATILGTIFFRDKTSFPLHVDDPATVPVVKFKGYRLINKYPEFHYSIDGVDVFELIRANKDGTGLVRVFRIPKAAKPVWFTHDIEDGIAYKSSSGKWAGGELKLLPAEAGQFVITMTKKKL